MGQSSLSYSGNIFDQQVSAGEQRNDCESHGFRLAANDALNRGLQQFNSLCRGHLDRIRTVGCTEVSHRLV